MDESEVQRKDGVCKIGLCRIESVKMDFVCYIDDFCKAVD